MLAQAAHAQRAIQRQDFHQPTDIGQPGQGGGQDRQRQHRQHPGRNAMTAPATAAGIETLLNTLGHTAKGNQRMPALGLAEQRIQRHPGDAQQRHTHGLTPQ